ncbi:GntR family transcriptional regulator [Blastopirellula sp. JC732]|uniref:GntR family transcriptional regulator n=1 Tax=Blastopirellula sediminis TaxID=2894196 RepID=A0A9X1MMR0_9BACT|nr:GntR family transcriptional regulator [Blastopirellula sediminis]MCC9607560.1 GntR family transcriptional regulator [Blastopirellula sediminis]MCC9629147.1 GntR family transcriptional regulator [Blastopirellula sediminis]
MASANEVQHGARRQKLVSDILLVLFEGKFAPGQRLRLEHLAEQFEVSVTPVREALVELAGIGVVELQPNRGAVLRPFGPRQVEEICQVRRILECEAVRSVCGRIAPFELELLESQFAELDSAKRNKRWSQKTREQDSQLHELIAERCGSERLAYEIGRYKVLFRTLRDARHLRRSSRDYYAEMNENAEHLEIVRAIKANDSNRASDAMAYHIEKSVEALIADLFDPQQIAADRRESFLTRQTVSS